MTRQTRWLEYGEPVGDRVEAAIRTTYETGPNEETREDDVERGTIDFEALELLQEDDEIAEHVHDDMSVMLSGLSDDAEDRLLQSFERNSWDRLEELLRDHDLSNAVAVDYVAVEQRGLSQSEWARRRGVAQAAVSENVGKAKDVLVQR